LILSFSFHVIMDAPVSWRETGAFFREGQ